MGQIKSALELALEKTANVKVDKEAVLRKEAYKNGRIIGTKFLEQPEMDIQDEIKKSGTKEVTEMKKGILDTLLANIILPQGDEINQIGLEKLEKGTNAVISQQENVTYVYQQILGLFQQYLENRNHYKEQLAAQYAPKLQEKAEKMRQQFGESIELTPESDPEFMQLLHQHLSQLEEQYQSALNQGKEQLKSFF